MRRKKTAIIAAVLLITVAAGIYFYYGILFKESRNIASETPDYSIAAIQLLEDYNADPKRADSLYLNKTIEITGIATKKTDSVITVQNSIFCLFKQPAKETAVNKTVTIKGKCIGYDELFQEVKLDQCTLINKQIN